MKDKEKQITINREAGAMVDLLNNEIEELQKAKAIEEMEDIISGSWNTRSAAKNLSNAGYRKLPEDSVVLSREEYEKLRSLYDCEQGSYMTSNIGDLPLTVEGLRKAVDEITRLNRVETELQELNAKYYNEAKDLRRELKQARKETAEKFAKLIEFHSISKRDESGYETFTISNLCMREILREQFGFTNEELETMWEIKE